MTCTFCGSMLDGNETECPYCGHKVTSEINFEEPVKVSSKFQTQPEQEYDDYEPEEEEYSEPAPSKRGGRSSSVKASPLSLGGESGGKLGVLTLGVAVLSLLISVITMFVCISTSTKVSDIEQDMLSQLYVLQSDINTSMSNIESSLTSSINTVVETTTNNSGDIKITHSPTEVTTVAVGDSNKILFNCSATGPDTLTFTWQKKSASGEWVAITWDETSTNTEYGLQVYDQPFTKSDGSDKYSQIMAKGLTEAAAGDYRCVVSDVYGHQATSDVATLHL